MIVDISVTNKEHYAAHVERMITEDVLFDLTTNRQGIQN